MRQDLLLEGCWWRRVTPAETLQITYLIEGVCPKGAKDHSSWIRTRPCVLICLLGQGRRVRGSEGPVLSSQLPALLEGVHFVVVNHTTRRVNLRKLCLGPQASPRAWRSEKLRASDPRPPCSAGMAGTHLLCEIRSPSPRPAATLSQRLCPVGT